MPHPRTDPAWGTLLDLGERAAGPLYLRLVRALRAAVVGGRIGAGSALPPSRSLAADLGHPDPAGHHALRERIAAYLVRGRGAALDAGQLLVCGGTLDAVLRLSRALRAAGHTHVAVEDPAGPPIRRRRMSNSSCLPAGGPACLRWGLRDSRYGVSGPVYLADRPAKNRTNRVPGAVHVPHASQREDVRMPPHFEERRAS